MEARRREGEEEERGGGGRREEDEGGGRRREGLRGGLYTVTCSEAYKDIDQKIQIICILNYLNHDTPIFFRSNL